MPETDGQAPAPGGCALEFSGGGLARGYRVAALAADGAALLLLGLFLRSAWRQALEPAAAIIDLVLGLAVAVAIHLPAQVLRRQADAVARAFVRFDQDGVLFRVPGPERLVRGRGAREELFVAWSEIRSVSAIDLPLAMPLEFGPLRLEMAPRPYRAYAIDTARGRVVLMPAALPQAGRIARTIAARAGVPFDRRGPVAS